MRRFYATGSTGEDLEEEKLEINEKKIEPVKEEHKTVAGK